MLEDQANRIIDNFKPLVHETNLRKLIQKMVEKGVPPHLIMKTPNFVQYDDVHNKRCFYFHLTRLDSSIFPKLVQSLRELNCCELANKLDSKLMESKHCEPFRLPDHVDMNNAIIECVDNNSNSGHVQKASSPLRRIIASSAPLLINVRLAKHFLDTDECNKNVLYYRTRSKYRGIVLVINNYEFCGNEYPRRLGAEVDDNNIRGLFTKMGLQVISHTNKTAEEIRSIILDFTRCNSIHIVDVCFVIFMSHGGEIDNQTVINGIDNFKVETAWIMEQFNNANCSYFTGKPKIFFFQTCRGITTDTLVGRRTQSDSATVLRYDRTYSDILVAYPTVRGYKAHRDTIRGSWFIDCMSEVFMEHSHEMHVENMLKKIDERFSVRMSEFNSMQTLHFENIGFKNCYLHPGIYEKSGQIMRFNDVGG